MRITTDQWRYVALARGEQRTRWRLIAVDDYDYEAPIEHLVIGEDRFPYFAGEFYIVPEHLANAFMAARATLELVMAQMDAHRITSGHHKRQNGASYWEVE